MRFVKASGFLQSGYQTAVSYPAPTNLSYLWNFGVFGLFCLLTQIVTGILLVMHYVPHVDLAFISVEHIMRDVPYGWLLRYLHANGASVFFIVIYIHIFRGIFFGSYLYPRASLWLSGVFILLLMIITAFLGYILPWGQMSFWGATVITNLASTIPFFGEDIVQWLWGGFSVDNPTLNKFFSLHYILPFVILALVGLHLIFLHDFGSSNPLGVQFRTDQIPFTPYFMLKDFLSVLFLVLFMSYFVFFAPNYLGHPDNYIPANPEVTPAHIVPEWYFLPFYAILRSIPDKLLGVVGLLASILVLFILPFLHSTKVRTALFKPFFQLLYYFFFLNCLLLGFIGSKPIEPPFLSLGQFCTGSYFFFFILLRICERFDYSAFGLMTETSKYTLLSTKRKNFFF